MDCEVMFTRRCPWPYGEAGCGERVCARLESYDEAPWAEELLAEEHDREMRGRLSNPSS